MEQADFFGGVSSSTVDYAEPEPSRDALSSKWSECSYCSGTGLYVAPSGLIRGCPDCKGTGSIQLEILV